jgi:hypothetical protein
MCALVSGNDGARRGILWRRDLGEAEAAMRGVEGCDASDLDRRFASPFRGIGSGTLGACGRSRLTASCQMSASYVSTACRSRLGTITTGGFSSSRCTATPRKAKVQSSTDADGHANYVAASNRSASPSNERPKLRLQSGKAARPSTPGRFIGHPEARNARQPWASGCHNPRISRETGRGAAVGGSRPSRPPAPGRRCMSGCKRAVVV